MIALRYFCVVMNGVFFLVAMTCCTKERIANPSPTNPIVVTNDPPSNVAYWLTTGDRQVLFQKQTGSLLFNSTRNSYPTIEVDSTKLYQTIDGFGGCLTQGSAYLINRLPETSQNALLKELFTTDSNYIGISYIRISIGASDLSSYVYSYDDIPAGQTDSTLSHFSLGEDLNDLVPLLKKIVALNPNIKILGSPWSAPVWMKTNGSFVGGSLAPKWYSVYAQYFVKYIQTMQTLGIPLDAITIQNEPLNPYNNPSMTMQAAEQSLFLKYFLGPAFSAANIHTRIILNENNPDMPEYPLSILSDPLVYQYADGSAFHLYSGDISGLTVVHNAYPDKNIYFTEQWVGPGDFGDYLKVHTKLLTVGAVRNWSRNVLEWNLASDQNLNPHTPGGCNSCMGSITVNYSTNTVTRNVGYYIIAHASKFVVTGSVRIASTMVNGLPNVAFQRPDGKKVLVVLNDSQAAQNFNIRFNNVLVTPALPAGAVGTFIW